MQLVRSQLPTTHLPMSPHRAKTPTYPGEVPGNHRSKHEKKHPVAIPLAPPGALPQLENLHLGSTWSRRTGASCWIPPDKKGASHLF